VLLVMVMVLVLGLSLLSSLPPLLLLSERCDTPASTVTPHQRLDTGRGYLCFLLPLRGTRRVMPIKPCSTPQGLTLVSLTQLLPRRAPGTAASKHALHLCRGELLLARCAPGTAASKHALHLCRGELLLPRGAPGTAASKHALHLCRGELLLPRSAPGTAASKHALHLCRGELLLLLLLSHK